MTVITLVAGLLLGVVKILQQVPIARNSRRKKKKKHIRQYLLKQLPLRSNMSDDRTGRDLVATG